MDPEVTATTNEQQDADDDFEAGFSSPTSPTETPGTGEQQTAKPEGDEGAQQTTTEPKQPEYVQITKDEWESLKSSAAEVGTIKATLEQRFGTAFGKIGGIERTLKELGEGGAKIDVPDADIEALKTGGFPELANALEQMRNLRALPGGGGLQMDAVEERVAAKVTEAQEAVRRSFELRLLRRDHPDYEALNKDPAFNTWFGTLPEAEKQTFIAANTGYDSEVMSQYITRFKKDREKAKAQAPQARQSRIAAAVTPRGTSAPAAQPTTDDEFEAGFRTG